MVLIFDRSSTGVLDLSFGSYSVIFCASVVISYLTTVLTSKGDSFGNGWTAERNALDLNRNRTWATLTSAVVEEAFSIPPKSYLRQAEQEVKLYTSIKALRDAQRDQWSILWLNGHIEQRTQQRTTDLMQILSRRLSADQYLAATFSCASTSWDAQRSLIPTLAYQLAISRPGTRSHMDAALAAHPSLLDQPPRVQFDHLITTPLVKDFLLGTPLIPASTPSTPQQPPHPPTYFLLDAFHKCGSDEFQTEILHAISRLTSLYQGPPLTFIIGSSVTFSLAQNFFAHHHLAQRTKPLIVDSSADDSTLFAGASVTPTPLLLRQAYSPVGEDHFYTTDADEFARAQHIAYRPIQASHNPYRLELFNAIGGVYSTSIPFGIPLFRLFNIGTGDHYYTTDMREVGDAVKVGYELECVAGFVLERHGEPGVVDVGMGVGVGGEVVRFRGNVSDHDHDHGMMMKPWELRRGWSAVKRDHVYVTLDNLKNGDGKLMLEGYVDEGVIGRLVPLF